jgi:hypothetical protein
MWIVESAETTPGCVKNFNNIIIVGLRAGPLLIPYHLVDFQLHLNLLVHRAHPRVVLYLSADPPIEEQNHGDNEAAHCHSR